MGKIESIYPKRTWDIREPGEVGLQAAELDLAHDAVGGRGCVVRYGYLVYTWGDASLRADVASAAKPVYAHFLFAALEKGLIPDLDQPILCWTPSLAGLNPNLGNKDKGITWRHLANQTSCYGVTEEPGTAFDYNDWQMALFWDTLFLRVYGAGYADVDERVLGPLLAEQIGCEDAPTFMAFGPHDRPGRLGISARDFARVGLLYLRQGRWEGKQLLRGEYARMAVTSSLPGAFPRTEGKPGEMMPGQRSIGSQRVPDNQCDHLGSYSWLWWTNGIDREGRRHWPDAPIDAYAALGHGGKRALVVVPGLDLIVSWNDAQIQDREMENRALKHLVQAARGG